MVDNLIQDIENFLLETKSVSFSLDNNPGNSKEIVLKFENSKEIVKTKSRKVSEILAKYRDYEILEIDSKGNLERSLRDFEEIDDQKEYLLKEKKLKFEKELQGFSKAQGFLYTKINGIYSRNFCVLKKSKLYLEKENDLLELIISLDNYDVYSLKKNLSEFTPLSLQYGFALKRQSGGRGGQDVLFFGVEKEQSCLEWIRALRGNRAQVMIENSDGDHKEKFRDSPQEGSFGSDDEDEPLYQQLKRLSGSPVERKGSVNSNASIASDDHRKGKIKPLLSFKSGEYGSAQRLKDSKEGSASKNNGKSNLLVDVSDAKLCQTCGCSEFRGIFTGRREAQCGNCLHIHSK